MSRLQLSCYDLESDIQQSIVAVPLHILWWQIHLRFQLVAPVAQLLSEFSRPMKKLKLKFDLDICVAASYNALPPKTRRI